MLTQINHFNKTEQAHFCQEQLVMTLIQTLKNLLVTNQFLTYKTNYSDGDIKHELNIDGQLDFHFRRPLNENMIQAVKHASNTWNDLTLINRLTVLDAYATLFQETLSNYNPVQKTILFCQIFVNDFADVITSR